METKGGKKSKKSSIQYESPLGYGIEDVRPHGGSEKFRTAAYSNVRVSTTSIFMCFLCLVVLSNNLDPRLLLLKVAFSAINSRHFLALHLAFLDGCPDIWEHWVDVGWCAVCAEAILIFAIHIGVDSLDFSFFFWVWSPAAPASWADQCPAQGSRFPSIFPLSISLVGNSGSE